MKVGFRKLVCLALVYTACVLPYAHARPFSCEGYFARLGNHLDPETGTLFFSLYSANATRVEIALFAKAFGEGPVGSAVMFAPDVNHPGLWRVALSRAQREQMGLAEGAPIYYGYRLWGPNWEYDSKWTPGSDLGFKADVDAAGNRFNPNKLAFDPRALEISHDPLTPGFGDESVYLSGPEYRHRNSGLVAPKGVVLRPPPQAPSPLTRPLREDILYETHVRGLTMADASVPEAERGTFKGAARKAKYLKNLGITAVEFLPVHAFQDDRNRTDQTKGNNYWGYMNLSYFALNGRFATETARATPGGSLEEFRAMVKAFHDEGIKVIMDVVYNHTGEGGARGSGGEYSPLQSMRAIDNATYYQVADDARFFKDNTGCGANLNCANPHVRQFILDTLAFYRDQGIDGFRFDLASVLGNVHEKGNVFYFDKAPVENVLNRALQEIPGRAYAGGKGVDLIAEPWAIGDNSFQVGGFPNHPQDDVGWAEWNGASFRDPIRKSQNKMGIERVTAGEIAHAVSGSQGLFGPSKRRPGHSINFVVSHDGFTNADLFRYNEKNNDQKGEFGPSDGGEDHNNSWDQKLPGESAERTAARQEQAAANGLALPLLSFGTPMFTGGDEFLRTQHGNNNMWNVDSPGNWIDWKLAEQNAGFLEFTKRLIQFRKSHPVFSSEKWFTGEVQPSGLRDISWHRPDGSSAEYRDLPPEERNYLMDPNQNFLGYRVDTSATESACRSIYIAYNYGPQTREIRLPPPAPEKKWYWAGDTSARYAAENRFTKPGDERLLHPAEPTGLGTYLIDARAIGVFVEK